MTTVLGNEALPHEERNEVRLFFVVGGGWKYLLLLRYRIS